MSAPAVSPIDLPAEALLGLVQWAERHDAVAELWIFGSRATGTARPESDVDVGLVMMPAEGKHDWALAAYFAFESKWKRELDAIVGRRVSIEPVVPETKGDVTRARDLLRSMMKEVYRDLVEGSEAKVILRLLVAEGRRFPELVQFYHSDVIVRGNAALSKIVELGVKRGEFGIAANDIASKILISPFVSA